MGYSEGSANQGLVADVIAQSIGQVSASSSLAQNNFVTVNKAMDYDFVEGKRVITMEEAVGLCAVNGNRTSYFTPVPFAPAR